MLNYTLGYNTFGYNFVFLQQNKVISSKWLTLCSNYGSSVSIATFHLINI